MKRFLLDTNAAGDYVNHRHNVRERAMQEVTRGNRIAICTPVLGELWFGLEYSASRDRNLHRLIIALADWIVWPYDMAAAQFYGQIAAELKRTGRIIQQIDIQIAAVARVLEKCTVVSADTDFTAVPGLDVENWALGQATN